MRSITLIFTLTSISLGGLACGESNDGTKVDVRDPALAPTVTVDRFSETAGMLMVRTADNGLPAAGAPIDFDQPPFITEGLGPDGQEVAYYNFDVQRTEPAPIYVLFREAESEPVSGQLNVIDVVPGDDGYNDFWQVHRVSVPADYVANTLTSYEEIVAAGHEITPMSALVNCPVVPGGSSAQKRLGTGATGLTRGWYRNQVVSYFSFEEAPLTGSQVPLSDIYVTFNVNPGTDGGGPASGFRMEDGSQQTHNVIATLPDDAGYSPLWSVNPYDNANFDGVSDLSSAMAANVLAQGVAKVNCPVVDAPE